LYANAGKYLSPFWTHSLHILNRLPYLLYYLRRVRRFAPRLFAFGMLPITIPDLCLVYYFLPTPVNKNGRLFSSLPLCISLKFALPALPACGG
ncbi:hypothetical protein KAW55_05925, partial [bacterium]|nr:hypothetical protein [bacterium]